MRQTTTCDSVRKLEALIDSLNTFAADLERDAVSDAVQKRITELAKSAQRLHRQYSVKRPANSVSAPKSPVISSALAELFERQALVRDRVRGVAKQGQAGFYLYGRAGTSKTHTVRTTLEDLQIDYEYQNGHITPIGLFETFEANPDKVIVLDDVGEIFSKPTAKGILLAALGNQPDGVRVIRYKSQGVTSTVRFRGGVIVISNLELHGDELMNAIKSRVQTLHYNPTDEQVAALLRHIASHGHVSNGERISPKQCATVCDFLLQKCSALGLSPDVRMLVDKAFKDYMLWKSGESETHWHDLVSSALQDQLLELSHPIDIHVPTKKEEEEAELALLGEILERYSDPNERLTAFIESTGKSKRTYHRRMRQRKARKGLMVIQ